MVKLVGYVEMKKKVGKISCLRVWSRMVLTVALVKQLIRFFCLMIYHKK